MPRTKYVEPRKSRYGNRRLLPLPHLKVSNQSSSMGASSETRPAAKKARLSTEFENTQRDENASNEILPPGKFESWYEWKRKTVSESKSADEFACYTGVKSDRGTYFSRQLTGEKQGYICKQKSPESGIQLEKSVCNLKNAASGELTSGQETYSFPPFKFQNNKSKLSETSAKEGNSSHTTIDVGNETISVITIKPEFLSETEPINGSSTDNFQPRIASHELEKSLSSSITDLLDFVTISSTGCMYSLKLQEQYIDSVCEKLSENIQYDEFARERKCEYCDVTYSNLEKFVKHFSRHERRLDTCCCLCQLVIGKNVCFDLMLNSLKYTCFFCSRSFSNISGIEGHLRGSSKGYLLKIFKAHSKVDCKDKEIEKQLNGRMYTCVYCYREKMFPNDLRRHLAKHTFRADFCCACRFKNRDLKKIYSCDTVTKKDATEMNGHKNKAITELSNSEWSSAESEDETSTSIDSESESICSCGETESEHEAARESSKTESKDGSKCVIGDKIASKTEEIVGPNENLCGLKHFNEKELEIDGENKGFDSNKPSSKENIRISISDSEDTSYCGSDCDRATSWGSDSDSWSENNSDEGCVSSRKNKIKFQFAGLMFGSEKENAIAIESGSDSDGDETTYEDMTVLSLDTPDSKNITEVSSESESESAITIESGSESLSGQINCESDSGKAIPEDSSDDSNSGQPVQLACNEIAFNQEIDRSVSRFLTRMFTSVPNS